MINLRIFHFGIWDAKKPQNMSNNEAISNYGSFNLKIVLKLDQLIPQFHLTVFFLLWVLYCNGVVLALSFNIKINRIKTKGLFDVRSLEKHLNYIDFF